MSRKLTTSIFIDRAIKIHENKYNYSKTDYKTSKDKVIIICPVHGEFVQIPDSHLNGCGCQKCAVKEVHSKQKTSKDTFNNKIKTIFPNLEILTPYNGASKKILVKDFLGIIYSTIPSNLLQGKIPSIISAIDKNEAFVLKAKFIHKNRYDYSKSIYLGDKTPLTITCLIHGDFKQSPTNHFLGKGCKLCNRNFGYNKQNWIRFCNNNKKANPKVYIVRCFNESESFVKIGITSNPTEKRFTTHYKFPYKFELLQELYGTPEYVFSKEKELHKKFKKYKYTPKLYFPGITECFNVEVIKLLPLH